jgi:hypothetical protein
MNANAQKQAQQLESMASQDLFKRMTGTCFTKCVRRYEDGEVTVGESELKDLCFFGFFFFFKKKTKTKTKTKDACVQRCVNKYLDTYRIVNEHMMTKNQEEQQKQQM